MPRLPTILPARASLALHPVAVALWRFARARQGATFAEYALLIGVIAVVALAGAKVLGTNVNARFGNAAARVANG